MVRTQVQRIAVGSTKVIINPIFLTENVFKFGKTSKFKDMKKSIAIFSIAVLALTGCGGAKSIHSTDMITGTVWELSSINGKKVDAASLPNGAPTATFDKEHKISGNSSCNGYGGSYNLNDEGGMNISEIMATKMYCEGSIETEYFKVLEKINAAKVDKNKLTLMEGVDERLVFVPKK